MFNLSIQDTMLLLEIASKSAEFQSHMWASLVQDGKTFEGDQWRASIRRVIPILARLDRENPGLLPVPHDGIPWAERE